jgi:hypothetical protein
VIDNRLQSFSISIFDPEPFTKYDLIGPSRTRRNGVNEELKRRCKTSIQSNPNRKYDVMVENIKCPPFPDFRYCTPFGRSDPNPPTNPVVVRD